MSVALLPDVLTGALLEVAVAWGADLTDLTGASWVWTDITSDVRLLPGIEPTNGRADEASTTQPASLTLTLDNTVGKYSLGPQAANYPYVRRGTPVRVRVRPSTAGSYVVVFQGNAVSWQPDWALRGNVSEVKLVAAGALRRMAQGASPVLSAIKRALIAQASTVAYWPCEDGKAATRIAAAIGTTSMTWSGYPDLASSDDFPCSDALPVMKGAVFYADVLPFTPNATDGSMAIRGLFEFPTTEQVDQAVIMRIFTTGTVARWDFRYNVGGAVDLKGYDRFDTLLVDQGAVAFGVKGGLWYFSVEMYQSGGNVFSGVNGYQIGSAGYGSMPAVPTVAGAVGIVSKVVLNPSRGLDGVAFGHINVITDRPSTTSAQNQLNANVGEDPFTRVTRLCSENAVPLSSASYADGSSSLLDFLGPQRSDTLLNLLRDAEYAGQGLLFDGVSTGLFFRTRRARESQTAALTIDASLSRLASPFDVIDDDQRTRNSATVSLGSGGAARNYRDTTGPAGSSVIGLYDTTAAINAQFDDAALHFAAWLVAQGTVVGYRYPEVTVNLRAAPSLVAAWLTVQPGTRIDITNLSAVLPTHPTGTLSLMVEGVTNHFDDSGWIGTARCSPFAPWRIADYANPTTSGDDAWITRVDQAATSGTAITSGSTSMSVTSALPWITTASFSGEFPFDVDVSGQQVTVTAITGTGTTQTFTITATKVVGTIASGATVQLWQPTLPGL